MPKPANSVSLAKRAKPREALPLHFGERPYHDLNGITSKFGCHFILKIDKIVMKKKLKDTIINGAIAGVASQGVAGLFASRS